MTRDVAAESPTCARAGGFPIRRPLSRYLRDVGVEGSYPFTPTIIFPGVSSRQRAAIGAVDASLPGFIGLEPGDEESRRLATAISLARREWPDGEREGIEGRVLQLSLVLAISPECGSNIRAARIFSRIARSHSRDLPASSPFLVRSISEVHADRRDERSSDVILVVVNDVPAALLEFLVAVAENVARFELGFEVLLEERQPLPQDDVDPKAW